MLDRDEYVEQAHFFRVLRERMGQQGVSQELLGTLKEELLATTKLPIALDLMAAELRHQGVFSPAMALLKHYFTAFQTFVVRQSESDRGQFDLYVGLEILEREAAYRAEGATPQGIFLYQFEAVSRNRLGYDKGLLAIGADAAFDESWREWIGTVRKQIGLVELTDLIYVRSQHYVTQRSRELAEPYEPEKPVLFGEKEGRIALANRRKDPLLLFAALARHLGYPLVPRPKIVDQQANVVPQLLKRVEKLETRLKLLEEDAKGGFDLKQFYRPPE